MTQELLDVLDETIQDLDESGFDDLAETLYALGYESTWTSDAHMLREIGMELMRIQSRLEGELPANVMSGMTRCMEIVRRSHPNLSLTDD